MPDVLAENKLRAIKLVHTIAWAFFVFCILSIPVFAWWSNFRLAVVLIGIVLIECLIILFNDWKCPLTPVAERFTSDRRPNFDIYLPQWLAKYNKEIFGFLFFTGVAFTVLCWIRVMR